MPSLPICRLQRRRRAKLPRDSSPLAASPLPVHALRPAFLRPSVACSGRRSGMKSTTRTGLFHNGTRTSGNGIELSKLGKSRRCIRPVDHPVAISAYDSEVSSRGQLDRHVRRQVGERRDVVRLQITASRSVSSPRSHSIRGVPLDKLVPISFRRISRILCTRAFPRRHVLWRPARKVGNDARVRCGLARRLFRMCLKILFLSYTHIMV